MRKISLLLSALILAGCADGATTAPTDGQGKDGPQLGGGSGCNITTWQGMSDPLSVSANSTGNDAQWFIKNNGTSAVTINSESFSGDGTVVTSTSSSNWMVFPGTLGAGQQVDADVIFDVAGPGTGGVSFSVFTSCGKKVFPSYTVNAN